MASLNEKIVIVTGASSGIGRAACLQLARRGARIVAAARRGERLESLAREIGDDGGVCVPVVADVTEEPDVDRLIGAAVERFSRVDILVNCAGRGLRRSVEETSVESWRSVIDTNLSSVFLCSRAAFHVMREQPRRGHNITVSSIAALYGSPMYAAYCASKHGVTGFARSLRWEARRAGVRVSILHPGRVDTEFFDVYPRRPAGEAGRLPGRRRRGC